MARCLMKRGLTSKEAWAKARSKVARPRDLRNDKLKMDLRIKANVTEAKKRMKDMVSYLSHFSPPCTTSSHMTGV